jgi:hypothetical protein
MCWGLPFPLQIVLFPSESQGGFDPISWLFRDHGGRDDPTDTAFLGEIAGEPLAARASFIDQDEAWAVGVQVTDELIDVTLSRPDVPPGDDLGVVVLGHISDRDRVLMDIHSDVARARPCHG